MKYLVLGSHGQIGTSLMQVLPQKGHEGIPFDIVNSIQEDLRIPDNPLLIDRMYNSDFVIFLAFDVGGSTYLRNYQNKIEFISNNIKIMENTFSILKQINKPFIFASSQMSNMLHSSYGLLKSIGDIYTKSLNGLIVKFWNVYGIEKDLEKSHVITDFILKAKKFNKIELMTDGSEERQFLFADDCSECLISLSEKYNEIPRDKDLHVSSFAWNSILSVAKIVSKLNNDIPLEIGNSSDCSQRYKKNEPDRFVLNYWKPKVSLFDGISFLNKIVS